MTAKGPGPAKAGPGPFVMPVEQGPTDDDGALPLRRGNGAVVRCERAVRVRRRAGASDDPLIAQWRRAELMPAQRPPIRPATGMPISRTQPEFSAAVFEKIMISSSTETMPPTRPPIA